MLHLCTAKGACLLLQTAAQLKDRGQPELRLPFVVTLAEAIARLIEAKRGGNRRLNYLKSLLGYLNRFAAGRDGVPLVSISTLDVEQWLARFPKPASRQTVLNRLSTLFSFAVRRGYISSNPCDRVERVTVDRKPPVILTPAQSQDLLASCPTICKPYLVLAMFAGIRPDEIMRLDWSQVNLEARTALVDGKTRRRRLVPLPGIAVDLLKRHPLRSGPVAPSLMTLRRWRRKAKAILGGKWTADVLRHTAASYLLALHKDAAKVALWLGNSPKILHQHYVEPVSEADCAAFWRGQAAAPEVARGSANLENGVAGLEMAKATL